MYLLPASSCTYLREYFIGDIALALDPDGKLAAFRYPWRGNFML